MNDSWALATNIVNDLVREKYPSAVAGSIGGSFARGNATATSDIDLVLVFPILDHAWRETIGAHGITVETFCHDPKTFEYFCRNVDLPRGRMVLGQMVSEGRNVLPPSPLGDAVREFALKMVSDGPPPLSSDEIAMRRYAITTLLEDLIDAVRSHEALAIGMKLFESLSDFRLRTERRWSGSGKQLVRILFAFDPSLYPISTKHFAFWLPTPSKAREHLNRWSIGCSIRMAADC